ncbi:MAG: right-handed parallel beta-helix repeat-containing protein, partial [Candidatus Peribacteraceae bacterium]|nr:right-handed parallel beta-helix repeat-containing protein [Candidatus Peribacteraceae bacterium]
MKSIKYIIFLWVFFLTSSVMAATYYVKTGGSNTSPYDTWAKASTGFGNLNSIDMANGSIINIRPGDTISDAQLNFGGVTGSSKSFTVQGLDGDGKSIGVDGKPIIDGNSIRAILVYNSAIVGITIKNIRINGEDVGNGSTSPWRNGFGMIVLNDLTNISIDGLDFYGHEGASSYSYLNTFLYIVSLEDNHTVEIKNCTMQDLRPDPVAYPPDEWVTNITYGGAFDSVDTQFIFFDNIPNTYDIATGGTIKIHDNTFSGVWADSIQADKIDSTLFEIYDNHFIGFGENAINLKRVHNAEIYNNDIERDDYARGGSGGGVSGIGLEEDSELWQPCDNTLIHDNYIHNSDGFTAIALLYSATNTKIYNNYIAGCTEGILVAGNSTATSIFNNLLVMSGGAGSGSLVEVGIYIYPSDADDLKIYNNTIYSSNAAQLYGIYHRTYAGRTGMEIKNNVIQLTQNSSSKYPLFVQNANDTPVIDYNVYYNANHINRIQYNGTDYDHGVNFAAGDSGGTDWAEIAGHTNEVSDNPDMTDPGNADFTLQIGSPCISNALAVGDTYRHGWSATTSLPPTTVTTINRDETQWDIGVFVADVTAPTISGVYPLPLPSVVTCTSDPRDVVIGWATDETANCRIKDVDEGDYDAMPVDSVDNTDSTNHDDTENLACDQVVTRYVYCEDIAGNESSVTTIIVTIQEPGEPSEPTPDAVMIGISG